MKDQISNLAFLVGFLGLSAGAWAVPASNALPTGEQVTFGSATFDRSVANQLTIRQTSTKLISNWDSFNIGAAAAVNFIQPNINSRALNRVITASPSQIFGKLNANGQIFLVNPAGITFGTGSQVQTGALLASVLGITDRNFIANELNFERGTALRSIINHGALLAKEGNVTLLGPNLQNTGSIESSKGNVFFANGDRLGVFDHNIALLQASRITSLIRNTGALTATRLETRKGQVLLLGESTNDKNTVELSGTINSQNAWAKTNKLYITGALNSTGNTALESTKSIYVNAPLTISGNSALLSLVYGPYVSDGLYLARGVQVNMTGSNPYFRVNGNLYKVIKNATDLQAIGTDSTSMAGKYVLVADVDASATATWNNGRGFIPIKSFSGMMNGLGHTISGLTINRSTTSNVGLFGVINSGSEVENLNLSNAVIHGNDFVGALAGKNSGTIYQVNVQANVTGADNTGGLVGLNYGYSGYIAKASSTGDVSGHDYVGGLVGSNQGDYYEYATIDRSYATGNVQGNSHIGGLVGMNYAVGGEAYIEDSYATGNVSGASIVGGLVGSNQAYTIYDYEDFYYSGSAYIYDSYSTGKVAGSARGGLVGKQIEDSDSSAFVADSYWNKDTAQTVGSAAGSALTNNTIKQMTSFNGWSISNKPIDATVWFIQEGISAPQLR